ncbi:MAG TPA: GspH/FimT family pseudopilin [Candidatus Binatia bacterium]
MIRQSSKRGFSLVEVVIVLQLTAIAAFIAVPNMNAFFARYQLMSASNQLGFDIARARMQAIGQNQSVRIRMLSGTQYVRETSKNGSPPWSNQVTTSLPRGVTVTTTSAQVGFDRRGFATVNNSITVSGGVQQLKTVMTNVIGRVTIASGVNT